jgi:HEAT repeat protein
MRAILALCLGVFVSGCSAGKSTETWVAQMQSRDASLRLEAVRALAERKSEATAVVPVLTKSLGDEDASVRRAAAQALGGMGSEARAALPGLLPLLKDTNAGVRKVAALALKRIAPEEAAKQ